MKRGAGGAMPTSDEGGGDGDSDTSSYAPKSPDLSSFYPDGPTQDQAAAAADADAQAHEPHPSPGIGTGAGAGAGTDRRDTARVEGTDRGTGAGTSHPVQPGQPMDPVRSQAGYKLQPPSYAYEYGPARSAASNNASSYHYHEQQARYGQRTPAAAPPSYQHQHQHQQSGWSLRPTTTTQREAWAPTTSPASRRPIVESTPAYRNPYVAEESYSPPSTSFRSRPSHGLQTTTTPTTTPTTAPTPTNTFPATTISPHDRPPEYLPPSPPQQHQQHRKQLPQEGRQRQYRSGLPEPATTRSPHGQPHEDLLVPPPPKRQHQQLEPQQQRRQLPQQGRQSQDRRGLPESPSAAESSASSSTMPPRKAAAPPPPPAPAIEPSPVKTKFPTARIKRIMQADEEVGKVAQQTPIAVGKALELFMIQLVLKSADIAKEKGSKRVTASMLRQVVEADEQWDFLREIVGRAETDKEGGKAKAKDSESDEEMEEPKKRGRGGGRRKKSMA